MRQSQSFVFFCRHNTEKVIYFLLLDRKMRQPSYEDIEENKQRSRSGSREWLTSVSSSNATFLCSFQRMCHRSVLTVIVQTEHTLDRVPIPTLIGRVWSVNLPKVHH